MAESNDNGQMTPENKKLLIDTGIKLFLIWQGIKILKDAAANITGAGGSVDRVDFNMHNTQVRQFPIGSDEEGNPIYEEIEDPWTPADITRRFGTVVRGWTGTYGKHVDMYKEIRNLGYDRARWFHNYWLDTEDPDETIYRWIAGEAPNELSPEGDEQKKTLQQLQDWGIGF